MEYKDNPFNDEADIKDLLTRVPQVNGEVVKERTTFDDI